MPIEWVEDEGVKCSRCGRPLTVPFAHIHFHYGVEGLSDEARAQLRLLVGRGQGDDTGPLGRDMCMSCFRELIGIIAKWRLAEAK